MRRRYEPQLIQPLASTSKKKGGYSRVITIDMQDEDDTLDEYVGSGFEEKNTTVDWWGIWCQATRRDKDDTPSPNTVTQVTEAVEGMKSTPVYRVEEIIRDASFLPPVYKDTEDVGRLILTLTEDDYRSRAREYSSRVNTVPYYYEDMQSMVPTVTWLRRVCSTSEDILENYHTIWECADFTRREIEKALNSLPKDTPPTPQDILQALREPNKLLFPSVSEENKAKYTPPKKDRALSLGGANSLDEITVRASSDLQVQDMIRGNYPLSIIIQHHNLAPQGYWEEVDAFLLDARGDVMDAYDCLEEKYGFHPEDREIPPPES